MAKDSVLRLAPPLCISAGEVDELAELVAETPSELQDEVARSARGRGSYLSKRPRDTRLRPAWSPISRSEVSATVPSRRSARIVCCTK